MVRYSKARISDLFHIIDTTKDVNVKGDALEDLACLFFLTIPGIKLIKRDFFNDRKSQEIDVGFFNAGYAKGLKIIDPIVIVECKSSSKPLCSKDTEWFISKIRRKHQKFGFLISLNGITGDPEEKKAAHDIVIQAFKTEGIIIFVIIREELEQIKNTDDFIELIEHKFTSTIIDETIFYKV